MHNVCIRTASLGQRSRLARESRLVGDFNALSLLELHLTFEYSVQRIVCFRVIHSLHSNSRNVAKCLVIKNSILIVQSLPWHQSLPSLGVCSSSLVILPHNLRVQCIDIYDKLISHSFHTSDTSNSVNWMSKTNCITYVYQRNANKRCEHESHYLSPDFVLLKYDSLHNKRQTRVWGTPSNSMIATLRSNSSAANHWWVCFLEVLEVSFLEDCQLVNVIHHVCIYHVL